ncbi:MAG: caspase domain-containing protein [Pirellulales bacterium]
MKTALFALMTFVFGCQAASARDAGQLWVLLIGPQDYQHMAKLQFSGNDCEQMAQVLKTNYGVASDHIFKLVDSADSKVTRDGAMAAVRSFLDKPDVGDEILVFYSGQGDKNAAGELMLPLEDAVPNQPNTALSAKWLLDALEMTPANTKTLILDTCYAAALFRQAKNTDVTIFASSAENEISYDWTDQRQGMYTRWLLEGLSGSADADRDGKVSATELDRFVTPNVARTSGRIYRTPQNPSAKIPTDVPEAQFTLVK